MQEWFPSQIVQKRQRGLVGKTIFRLTRESVSSSPRFSRLLHPQPGGHSEDDPSSTQSAPTHVKKRRRPVRGEIEKVELFKPKLLDRDDPE